ncbi:MAG: NADH-quinone oxidoreductase subunit J [Acidiphilium sp.]|nr:NADH-quinone oxidoreductase subunit J [Acidiphilium sp.]MDD4936570.1 NADH-quinone oxidoreductase subunit J [Acidiphilium sp.]
MNVSGFDLVFYGAASFSMVTTAVAITRSNPVYGLLNFVLSLLGMAVVFYTLGAPFAAALEVIVYAGAIMVLFLFVVMMLKLDRTTVAREASWITSAIWIVPILLGAMLGGELVDVLLQKTGPGSAHQVISPQAVGLRLFTTDLGAVELASMLLLAGLIGAYHLGRPSSEGD